ncbi:MAG: hypothetical protein E6Q48_05480 [Limnohabitans sp.]|nr:MAG: hypothetical protein E6Q48_05480 [Limnohabitans sp.]
MSGAAFLRLKKLTGGGIWLAAARHNKRVIQAELGAGSHITPTRSRLNISLIGPQTPEEVARLAKERISLTGASKPRKNAVLGVELVFSLPKNHRLDVVEYFTACAQWAGQQFGGMDNIISADIHRDEAQDHAHVLLVPLIDGRLKGSDAVGNKRKLAELQTSFFYSVATGFGFSKPRSKLSGNAKAQTVKRVLDKLINDPAAKSVAWSVIRDSVERDPLPYALTLGIEVEQRAKPIKTMAQIFTSKGKGSVIREQAKPYKVLAPEKSKTLGLCMESPSPISPDIQHPLEQLAAPAVVRVRDIDQRPEHYDPITGEHFTPRSKSLMARLNADQWVAEAISARRGT